MKILVVGAGSIGQRYARYAREIAGSAALCDLAAARLEAFKDEGGVVFCDFDEALKWKPDGVILATPHKTHISLATKVIDADLPVLIEKPIGHDYGEVQGFLAHLKAKQGKAYTVSNMRFHAAIQCLQDNLHKIGDIYFSRAHFGNWLPGMRPDADYKKLYCAHKDQGGGVIYDCIHEIDYLLWLFGPAARISATADKRSDLDIDVEDCASMALQHECGVMTEIHMDYLQQCKRRGVEIIGRQGTLIWQSEGKNPEECRVRLYTADKGWRVLYEAESLDITAAYKNMLQTFFAAIKTPGALTSLATAEDGAAALYIAMKAYQSIDEKREIMIEAVS